MRALVVGSSGGIGAALVRALKNESSVDHVTAWSRGASHRTSGKLTCAPFELLDESSIALAASTLGELDLVFITTGLLHDGDAMRPERTWSALDAVAMRRSFEVNTIGPAIVAKHVLPLLPRDRRSVFAVLSARVGSIGDNRLGGWHSYRASKAALNQIIRCLAIELGVKRPEAICVGLHPGTVDTELSKPFQANVSAARLFTPDQAAGYMLDVIAGLTTTQSGKVIDWEGRDVIP